MRVGFVLRVDGSLAENPLDGRTAGTRGGREEGGFAATVAAETGGEVERLIGAGTGDGVDFEAVETAERLPSIEPPVG